MTESEFITAFEDHIKTKYGTSKAAAKKWKVSPQFVSKVLRLDAKPIDKMLRDIGCSRHVSKFVTYTPTKSFKGKS